MHSQHISVAVALMGLLYYLTCFTVHVALCLMKVTAAEYELESFLFMPYR